MYRHEMIFLMTIAGWKFFPSFGQLVDCTPIKSIHLLDTIFNFLIGIQVKKLELKILFLLIRRKKGNSLRIICEFRVTNRLKQLLCPLRGEDILHRWGYFGNLPLAKQVTNRDKYPPKAVWLPWEKNFSCIWLSRNKLRMLNTFLTISADLENLYSAQESLWVDEIYAVGRNNYQQTYLKSVSR